MSTFKFLTRIPVPTAARALSVNSSGIFVLCSPVRDSAAKVLVFDRESYRLIRTMMFSTTYSPVDITCSEDSVYVMRSDRNTTTIDRLRKRHLSALYMELVGIVHEHWNSKWKVERTYQGELVTYRQSAVLPIKMFNVDGKLSTEVRQPDVIRYFAKKVLPRKNSNVILVSSIDVPRSLCTQLTEIDRTGSVIQQYTASFDSQQVEIITDGEEEKIFLIGENCESELLNSSFRLMCHSCSTDVWSFPEDITWDEHSRHLYILDNNKSRGNELSVVVLAVKERNQIQVDLSTSSFVSLVSSEST